jgi:hypothetical protein
MKRIIKFICFLIVISGTSLSVVFSQVVDAGPDTTICKGNSIQIGSSGSDPSWCFTWSPDSSLNDKKAPEPVANPVSTTKYKLTVVGPDFSFTDRDDMTVKVINPKVVFSEDPAQKYGFDNYGVNNASPWKSLKTGDNDKVYSKITPFADYGHIFFKSTDISNFSLTPKKAVSNNQVLTLTGVIKGSAQLQANGDEENGVNINSMNVRAYNELAKTVAIIVVDEENDDEQQIKVGFGSAEEIAIEAGNNGIIDSSPVGDDNINGNIITTGSNGICQTHAILDDIQIIPADSGKANTPCIYNGANHFWDTKKALGDDKFNGNFMLTGADGICNTLANDSTIVSNDVDVVQVEDYLNDVYKQAAIVWSVTHLDDCVCNYDLNRNDSVEVKVWSSPELEAIRQKCGVLGYDKNIFLVNNPTDHSYGFMQLNQTYGFVHADRSPNPPNTIAHELGHGLGLAHTFETSTDPPPEPIVMDEKNLMHPTSTEWRLRKYQWDIINP